MIDAAVNHLNRRAVFRLVDLRLALQQLGGKSDAAQRILDLVSDLSSHLPDRSQRAVASQLGLRARRIRHVDEYQDYALALTGDDQRRGEKIKQPRAKIDPPVVTIVRRRLRDFFRNRRQERSVVREQLG